MVQRALFLVIFLSIVSSVSLSAVEEDVAVLSVVRQDLVAFAGSPIHQVQAQALDHALHDPQGTILRLHFHQQAIQTNALVGLQTPISLEAIQLACQPHLQMQRDTANDGGLPPPMPQVVITLADDLKRRSRIPVCLVRLWSEEKITIRSDFSTGRSASTARTPIIAEETARNLDPFGQPEGNASEYLLCVTQAPEDHPLVQALATILGDQVPIYRQLLPDGRPGLATLAYSRTWAAVASLVDSPRFARNADMLCEGWTSMFPSHPIRTDVHLEYFLREYRTRQVAWDAMDRTPQQRVPIAAPDGVATLVPAFYTYQRLEELVIAIETLGAGRPAAPLSFPRAAHLVELAQAMAQMRAKAPDSTVDWGQKLGGSTMVAWEDLPIPITGDRRIYTVPTSFERRQWTDLVQASPWKDQLYRLRAVRRPQGTPAGETH